MKTWTSRLWNEKALHCMDDSEPELRKKAKQTFDAMHDIRESRISTDATHEKQQSGKSAARPRLRCRTRAQLSKPAGAEKRRSDEKASVAIMS